MEVSNKELLSCFSWYANKVSESVVYANWTDGFARSEVHQHTMNFLSALRKLIDLTKLTREEAKDLSFQKWKSDVDLYLIPLYLLPLIPVGTALTSIDGKTIVYDGFNVDKDVRFGCIAYGIRIPKTKEERKDENKMIFSDAEIHCPCDTCSHKAVCKAETVMQNLAYDIGNNISYSDTLLDFLRCIEIKCDKYEKLLNLSGRRDD